MWLMLKKPKNMAKLQTDVIAWYRAVARPMPWRAPPGSGLLTNPYHVWLSEIMLQQTTVTAVIPYFLDFVKKWPSVAHLAAASLDEVLSAWAGLGYYARARNLHACAQKIVAEYGGVFPDTEEGLLVLPGIGPYTAAAIAAIAFNRDTVAVDGNVERVTARIFGIETPLPAAKPMLRDGARVLAIGNPSPSEYVQALMELGATVCVPQKPRCTLCPLRTACAGLKQGIAEQLPVKAPKKAQPEKFGVAFYITDPDGRFLARTRPSKGLLAGMTEVPTTPWDAVMPGADPMLAGLPGKMRVSPHDGARVLHVFTHFRLSLDVWVGTVGASFTPPEGCFWVEPQNVETHAFPTLMTKVLALAQTGRRH